MINTNLPEKNNALRLNKKNYKRNKLQIRNMYHELVFYVTHLVYSEQNPCKLYIIHAIKIGYLLTRNRVLTLL